MQDGAAAHGNDLAGHIAIRQAAFGHWVAGSPLIVAIAMWVFATVLYR